MVVSKFELSAAENDKKLFCISKMSLELNLLERSNFEVIIGRKPPRNAKYTKIYHDFNHYRTT